MTIIKEPFQVPLKTINNNIELNLSKVLKAEGIATIDFDKLSCDVHPEFKLFRYNGKPLLKVKMLEFEYSTTKVTITQTFEIFSEAHHPNHTPSN